MAQLMPQQLNVSCLSKIQIDFTFLVLAYLGSPGKRAAKRVCARYSLYFTTDQKKPTQLTLPPRESRPASNTWFLGPIRVHSPNAISIGSADSAGITVHTNRQIHHSALHARDSSLAIPPTQCITLNERAFPVARVWNDLPPTVRALLSLLTFRQQLKTFLFHRTFY